jgi:hypothetical protein
MEGDTEEEERHRIARHKDRDSDRGAYQVPPHNLRSAPGEGESLQSRLDRVGIYGDRDRARADRDLFGGRRVRKAGLE